MSTELITFSTQDGIKLNGFINKSESNTDKILIYIHGMVSNCHKAREKAISEEISKMNIDMLLFDNRGSEIVKYFTKTDSKKIIAGTAYENIEECYFDITAAIEYAIEKGYKEIYLEGHSLGSTKIIYSYNKMRNENYKYFNNIKGIILLSLVDIPDMFKLFSTPELLDYINKREEGNKQKELMLLEGVFHPLSIKNILRYLKYNEDIDFAKYSDKNYEFKELNNIDIPLFMRWGNNGELISQDAKEIVDLLNSKIKNKNKDINYINGANHSYKGNEEILAKEISEFLSKI